MTIQVKEFDMLIEIQKHLNAEGSRPELAAALLRTINRMHREYERAWVKNHRPKPVPESMQKQLAKEEAPLMRRLLDAGYPLEDMDHHESALYVYVTPLSTKVISLTCVFCKILGTRWVR